MGVKSAKKPFVAISSRLIQYNAWTIVRTNNVVTCCVRLQGTTTMLALVGTCCVKFGIGQNFDLTSPNISVVL